MWVDTHTHTSHGFNNPGVKHAHSLLYFRTCLVIAWQGLRAVLEVLAGEAAVTTESLALIYPRAPRIAGRLTLAVSHIETRTGSRSLPAM